MYRNKRFEQEKLQLKPGKFATALGPGLVLDHCRIECYLSAKELSINDAEIIGCTFIAMKTLTGFKFLRARLYDSKIEGNYSGCDFGKKAGIYNEKGDLARCDFSSARLDGCRFFNCDMSSLTFNPTYPVMIVIRPRETAARIDQASVHPRLQAFISALKAEDEECCGIVDDMNIRAKRSGVDIEEVQLLASGLSG